MASKPRVFFSLPPSGNVRGIAGFRQEQDGTTQTLTQTIPDGDTISVHMDGSGAVRFLGIDTPEKSFELAGQGRPALDDARWIDYLRDPFAPRFGPFSLEPALEAHLRARASPTAAVNHHQHGEAARVALTLLVQNDLTALGQEPPEFGFFLSFSYEVFDSYGRFLAFINRNQPTTNAANPRPSSYNERLLESGATLPYFIWPNIAPFRDADTVLDAVVPVGLAADLAQQSSALRRARDLVKAARSSGVGVFDPADPLQFEAFEIRYLGRRVAPNRPVIDLSKNENLILRPQSYFKIPHPEDRLFIPREFVPAFVAKGWRLEGWD
ncbi:MAG: hypothetical protein U5O69_07240 [Candidatus Competibacteraceae bacterium]|nr:hypothetical protein [Candidatus Competibacteraceae bacterium]